jgi:hypothetical protein
MTTKWYFRETKCLFDAILASQATIGAEKFAEGVIKRNIFVFQYLPYSRGKFQVSSIRYSRSIHEVRFCSKNLF